MDSQRRKLIIFQVFPLREGMKRETRKNDIRQCPLPRFIGRMPRHATIFSHETQPGNGPNCPKTPWILIMAC